MNEYVLIDIKEVCDKYSITSRTLRFSNKGGNMNIMSIMKRG